MSPPPPMLRTPSPVADRRQTPTAAAGSQGGSPRRGASPAGVTPLPALSPMAAGSPLVGPSPVAPTLGSPSPGVRPPPLVRPPVYIFLGRKYDSESQLKAAMQGVASASFATGAPCPTQQLELISALLEDVPKFKSLVHELFEKYAGRDRLLQQPEAVGLTLSLGAHVGIFDPLREFGEVQQMFWRFDFSGTGELSEDECANYVRFILRKVRDRLTPESRCLRNCALPQKILKDEYTIVKELGKGGQGAVYLATRGTLGSPGLQQQRVVKFYSKADANAPLDDIKEEFLILKMLDHPTIARVHDIFEDNDHAYVVSEPYFGGDLTALLENAGKNGVSANVAWLGNIFKQVLEGVAYIHSQKIMHCDLKEPNIMIANNSEWHNPRIVIIDFGMSKDFSGSREGGTPGYMPPEVWQMGLWTPRGDIFSLAVVFWSIFNGRQGGPFIQKDQPPFNLIRNATAHMPMDCSRIPDGLQGLTAQMASKDFQKRPSAKACLDNPFFQNLDCVSRPLDTEVVLNLSNAAGKSSIHNLIAADMCQAANLSQLQQLNELFLRLDRNNDGQVEEGELRETFSQMNLPSEQVNKLIQTLMGDDGFVRYSDFMAKLLFAQRGVQEAELKGVFASIDTDGSGTLDHREIKACLARPQVARLMAGRSTEDVIREMDSDNDGSVTFAEFQAAMLGSSDPPSEVPSWKKGDAARYFSVSRGAWLPCRIDAVDQKTGAVTINLKPGRWLQRHEQQAVLVKSGKAWAVGDVCQFRSGEKGKQIECRVQEVDPCTGNVIVDALPGQWLPPWKLEGKAGRCLRPACPGGHYLQKFCAERAGWSCDRCAQQVPVGGALWGCRPCNYDCCFGCIPSDAHDFDDVRDAVTAPSTQNVGIVDDAAAPDGEDIKWQGRVLKEHKASDDLQLNLKVGDLVAVLEEDSSGWVGGHVRTTPDLLGWFPRFCIDRIDPPEKTTSPRAGPESAAGSAAASASASEATAAPPSAEEGAGAEAEQMPTWKVPPAEIASPLATTAESPVRGRRSVATPQTGGDTAWERGDDSKLSECQEKLECALAELDEERQRRRNTADQIHQFTQQIEQIKASRQKDIALREAAEAEVRQLRVELALRDEQLSEAEARCLRAEGRLEARALATQPLTTHQTLTTQALAAEPPATLLATQPATQPFTQQVTLTTLPLLGASPLESACSSAGPIDVTLPLRPSLMTAASTRDERESRPKPNSVLDRVKAFESMRSASMVRPMTQSTRSIGPLNMTRPLATPEAPPRPWATPEGPRLGMSPLLRSR